MLSRLLLLLSLAFCVSTTLAQDPFSNACARATELHVVVLGSSTAAGTGPSVPDSTWVNRYRAYLQRINPNNQVTNLARGGTTTYNIMPDSFSPPPGRPMMDSARNISQALRLQPDAILVNYPSNDASARYGAAEQMQNFRLIAQVAQDAGVPVWICTTQPRNFTDSARIATQLQTRDSIQQVFPPYVLDFWSGLADSNHHILPIYDSGDGVHMNDAAHGILEARVRQLNLPLLLADTPVVSDFVLFDRIVEAPSICGDDSLEVAVIIGLNGYNNFLVYNDVDVVLMTPSGVQSNRYVAPLDVCDVDTLYTYIHTNQAGYYSLRAHFVSLDTLPQNDSSALWQHYSLGQPSLTTAGDTACLGDPLTLLAWGGTALDTVLWYDQPTGGQPIGGGFLLPLSGLLQSQTFYATQVRGPLYYVEQLQAATTTNVDWNGVTFDLVASGTDTLVVDSLSAKLATTGQQAVVAYYRRGSQAGYANQPAAWMRWDSVAVNVTASGELYGLDVGDLVLAPGDTVGVYLHMQNAASRLSYQRSTVPLVYQDGQLTLIGGSGVSHTFGALYTPRNWGGRVHYHHGYNPGGYCQTPRRAVAAVVEDPLLDLGADTLLLAGQSLTLAPMGAWASYAWSTGSTQASLLVDSSTLGLGIHTIVLDATTASGCSATDTIVVTISPATGLPHLAKAPALQLSPNPSTGFVLVQSGIPLVAPLCIYNAQGICVYIGQQDARQVLDLSALPPGMYWVFATHAEQTVQKSLILQK